MDEHIPFHKPLIDEDDIAGVVDTLRNGWLTTGRKTKEFEEVFREYVGSKHALAVNSCTAAMHLAVAALGLEPGDEVITTPYTFVATSEVILYMGAKPVFVDVQESDANIGSDRIREAITPRTKGIIPVHVAGMPCRMDEIMNVAAEHGLWVVEDAAHAIESSWKGVHTGCWGTAGAYSFYPTKNITTGEGGMLVTEDDELMETARRLALHGMSRDAWKRYDTTGSWYYEIVDRGYKYNLTDIASSLGLSQMKKIDGWLKTRTEYADILTAAFADHPALDPPVSAPAEAVAAHHLYPLRLNLDALAIGRSVFIEELREEGVGTSVHFIPLHLQPYYREAFGYESGMYPVAEGIYERMVSLPLYPGLTEEQVKRIAAAAVRVADRNMA